MATKAGRIRSIDFWRGFYLLMIYINHVPGNLFSYLTLRNWGFSDSAEPFVFISGFSAMLAFGKFYDVGFMTGVLRTIKRTWQLFAAHVLVVFAMSAAIAVAGDFIDSKPIMEAMNFSPFFVETDIAVVRLLKLSYMPNMTDILPLYIVFVLLFPIGWILLKRSTWLALVASGSLWWWANVTGTSFSNYPEGYNWYFNPLAWQVLFIAGMASYKERSKIESFLKNRNVFWAAVSVLVVSFLVIAPWTRLDALASWRFVSPEILAIDSSENLSWIRLVHFAALAIVAVRLFPSQSRLWDHPFVSVVSLCGKHSLPIFCSGILLSLIVYIVLQIGQIGFWEGALCVLGGASSLIAFAYALQFAQERLRKVAS